MLTSLLLVMEIKIVVNNMWPGQIIGTLRVKFLTFLLGECMTGAGGDGGPRGIFLFTLSQTSHCGISFAIKSTL